MRLAWIAALVLGAVSAGPAAAGTVSVEVEGFMTALVFTAAPGEANDVSLVGEDEGNLVTVTDLGAPLAVSTGCTSTTANEAVCTVGFDELEVRVETGDMDDSAVVELCVDAFGVLSGGGGDDSLVSRSQVVVLVGGPGADVMSGEAGECGDVSFAPGAEVSYAERTLPVFASLDGIANDGEAGEGDLLGPGIVGIVGGSADDVLRGRTGGQALRGRGGSDLLIGLGGQDSLLGGRGDDVLKGGPGRDSLDGGRGRDTLLGGPESDEVFGGPGADLLKGGLGQDWLVAGRGRDRAYGGPGKDSLDLKDGYPDVGIGGSQADSAWRDARLDRLVGIEVLCRNVVSC